MLAFWNKRPGMLLSTQNHTQHFREYNSVSVCQSFRDTFCDANIKKGLSNDSRKLLLTLRNVICNALCLSSHDRIISMYPEYLKIHYCNYKKVLALCSKAASSRPS